MRAGETLSVIGGDIDLIGAGELRPILVAPSGRMHLVSVASAGDVDVSATDRNPPLDVESFARLGSIGVSNGARVLVSGADSGTVAIRGNRLVVDNARIEAITQGAIDTEGLGIDIAIRKEVNLRNEAQLIADSRGAGDASGIHVTASVLQMDNAIMRSEVREEGNAGEILVEVDNLTLTEGAQVSGTTRGLGHGGNITIQARDTVTVAGSSPTGRTSGIVARTRDRGMGNGGAILVKANRVIVSDGGVISATTTGPGRGGSITVRARDTVALTGIDPVDQNDASGLFARTQGAGDGGMILIEAGHITLSDGAQINGTTSGRGRGGNITVRARDTVTVQGASPRGTQSGILARTTGGQEAGDGGTILVDANQVTVSDGGVISATTTGPGRGGNITVHAQDTVTLMGINPVNQQDASGIFARATSTGDGGNITVQARHIQLSDGGSISAESNRTGNAGQIRLTAVGAIISEGGRVTTQSRQADGGNIVLCAPFLRLMDSDVTAEARGSNPESGSDGGNVTMRGEQMVFNQSRIQANASGGDGGNIEIGATEVFIASAASVLDASSQLGLPGTVKISSPEVDLSDIVMPLTPAFNVVGRLLLNRCAELARTGNDISFVVSGRDYIPIEPDHILPSPSRKVGE